MWIFGTAPLMKKRKWWSLVANMYFYTIFITKEMKKNTWQLPSIYGSNSMSLRPFFPNILQTIFKQSLTLISNSSMTYLHKCPKMSITFSYGKQNVLWAWAKSNPMYWAAQNSRLLNKPNSTYLLSMSMIFSESSSILKLSSALTVSAIVLTFLAEQTTNKSLKYLPVKCLISTLIGWDWNVVYNCWLTSKVVCLCQVK